MVVNRTIVSITLSGDLLNVVDSVAKSANMTRANLIKSIIVQDTRIAVGLATLNAPPPKERASGYVSVKRQHKLRVEKEREDKAEQLQKDRLAAQERHAAIATKDLLAEMAKLDDEDQQHDEDMKDL